jgi:hypothetical protein
MAAAKAVQELVNSHLMMVAQAAKEVASEVLKEQMEAFEQRVKANLEKIEKLKLHSKGVVEQQHEAPPVTGEGGRVGREDGGSGDEKAKEIEELSQTTVPFQINSSQSPPSRQVDNPSAQSSPLPSQQSSHELLNRSVSLPFPSTTSIIVGAGTVIPIVSLQSLFINTSESKLLFLRRFVTTQVPPPSLSLSVCSLCSLLSLTLSLLDVHRVRSGDH